MVCGEVIPIRVLNIISGSTPTVSIVGSAFIFIFFFWFNYLFLICVIASNVEELLLGFVAIAWGELVSTVEVEPF